MLYVKVGSAHIRKVRVEWLFALDLQYIYWLGIKQIYLLSYLFQRNEFIKTCIFSCYMIIS